MLRHFPSFKKPSPLDVEIARLLKKMQETELNTEEYSKLMDLVERHYILKNQEARKPVSRDTMAVVLGNFFGLLLLVAYEQKHVITSKGFTQIIRPKVPGAQ